MSVRVNEPIDSEVIDETDRRLGNVSIFLGCLSAILCGLMIALIDVDKTNRVPIVTWHPLATPTAAISALLGVAAIMTGLRSSQQLGYRGYFGIILGSLSVVFLAVFLLAVYED